METIKAHKRLGRPVTDEVMEEAIARGKQLYGSIPRATAVYFDNLNREIEISFEAQDPVRLPINQLKEFTSLSDNQLSQLKVGFAGKGLILDEADLHISIQGFIAAQTKV